MDQKKQTPQVRFKGYTDAWKQCKLSEFVDKAVDNRGKTPPLDENGTHPLIEVAALGGVHPDYSKVEKYLNDDSFENSLRAYIKEGDILFTTVGSIGLVSLMDSREEAVIAQNIVAFRAKENFVPEYLYALFSNEENQCKAKRIVMGAVQPSIKVSQLVDVEYMLTENVNEQKKIGMCFSNLDNLITLHQCKYNKLLNLKKAMLEKMFPQNGSLYPEIRFKGFTDAWEQRKLGDIVERVVRKNTNNESSLPLTISAQYGLVDQITYFNNRVASRDVSNYYLVLNGEFAYNKSTSDGFPFGAVKRLDLYEKGVLSTLYIVFSIRNQSKTDSDFLTVFFDTDRWHKGVAERAAEGARNHGLLNISADDFFDIDIFLPSHREEQAAIGSYLRQLDHLITLHQRKIEKLKQIKKSCLEKLFV